MTDRELRERLRDLYGIYRTAAMNTRYYGARLEKFRRRNMGFEIAIAVGSSSSIGGWVIWKEGGGVLVWAGLTGAAAVLAVLKPILNLSKQIERYSKLFIEHGTVCFDLDRIVKEVVALRAFPRELQKGYLDALARRRKLSAEDDPRPDERLLRRCFNEVNQQIRPEDLWLPPGGNQ